MISKETSTDAIMLSMDNFGKWLLETLEEKGITQSEVSRRSGLSRGTLSNIISGNRGRGPDSLEAIARALKLPIDLVYRRAGLLPEDPDEDPWVEESSHQLKLINPNRRGVVSRFLTSMIDDEEEPQPKPKSKPKTRSSTP